MKKKALALLLGLSVLAGTLAGCGAEEKKESEASKDKEVVEESKEEVKEESKEEAKEPEELVEIVWAWDGEAPSGIQEVEDALNEMTEKDIGVHVTLYPMTDMDTQLALDVATGTQIDLVLSFGNSLHKKVTDGLIQPVDDYLEYATDIMEDCGNTFKGGQYCGVQYGFPLAWSSSNGYGIVVDGPTFEKYGFHEDKRFYNEGEFGAHTWEDIEYMFV